MIQRSYPWDFNLMDHGSKLMRAVHMRWAYGSLHCPVVTMDRSVSPFRRTQLEWIARMGTVHGHIGPPGVKRYELEGSRLDHANVLPSNKQFLHSRFSRSIPAVPKNQREKRDLRWKPEALHGLFEIRSIRADLELSFLR